MNARSTAARRKIRITRRAVKAVATGAPQPAKTHLIASGIGEATAKRFAGAFSTGVTPTATGEKIVKGRRTDGTRYVKIQAVKLYDTAAFAARLSTYRPKNPGAAELFARAAHRLAA